MAFKGIVCDSVYYIHLTQDWVQQQAAANMVMNL